SGFPSRSAARRTSPAVPSRQPPLASTDTPYRRRAWVRRQPPPQLRCPSQHRRRAPKGVKRQAPQQAPTARAKPCGKRALGLLRDILGEILRKRAQQSEPDHNEGQKSDALHPTERGSKCFF